MLYPVTLEEPDQRALQRLRKQRNQQNNREEERRLTRLQIARRCQKPIP